MHIISLVYKHLNVRLRQIYIVYRMKIFFYLLIKKIHFKSSEINVHVQQIIIGMELPVVRKF
jgi:hypothetical protein